MEQGLGVAMRVNSNVLVGAFENRKIYRAALSLVFNKLFEQEAPLGDAINPIDAQLTIIFDEHRVAGWFQEQDRSVIVRPIQQIDVRFSKFGCEIQVSLTEGGTSAAFSFVH
jgi:hypothetical protein